MKIRIRKFALSLSVLAMFMAGETAVHADWATDGYGMYVIKSNPVSGRPIEYIWSNRQDYEQRLDGRYQRTWVNTDMGISHWGVTTYQPSTDGIKAYPSYKRHLDVRYEKITQLDSVCRVLVPPFKGNLSKEIRYCTAYDLFFRYPDPANPGIPGASNRYEVMIWMNHDGAVAPAGIWPIKTGVSVGGATWSVYRAANFANNDFVYTMIREEKTTDTYVNIRGLLNWLDANYTLRLNDLYLTTFSFGFEITSAGPAKQYFTAKDWNYWIKTN